jgi:hypothetical protein
MLEFIARPIPSLVAGGSRRPALHHLAGRWLFLGSVCTGQFSPARSSRVSSLPLFFCARGMTFIGDLAAKRVRGVCKGG